MYYEMRIYTIKVGRTKEYNSIFESRGLPVISKYLNLVGWWHAECGELNQIIHLWAYASLDDRQKRREALYNDSDWINGFVPKAFPLIEKQESKILVPSKFSPIR